mmetsp:Transcript_297/g.718  ORF Transcript_297/g.718 Transcript_297/m.718 type:complete len:256 (+) Transcript_297:117-884(+)
MAMCPGDTTEWDDIQRKFGNFAPKEREIPQRVLEQAVIDAVEQLDPLSHCGVKDLDELEDDVAEDTLARYRRQRLAELKASQRAARFGQVLQVTRTTFVQEVTEASANKQWVLVLLYVDAIFECQQLQGPWAEAAKRFPAVKFMRGVADEIVPDFPDSSTPAVLVYRDTDCQEQLIGLSEWGGGRCSADCVEWVLSRRNIVETELEDDPRQAPSSSAGKPWARPPPRRNDDRHSSDEDEDDRDDRCYTSTKLGRR